MQTLATCHLTPQIRISKIQDDVTVVAVFQNALDLRARESAPGHRKLLCGCILLKDHLQHMKDHLRHMFRYQYRMLNMWLREGCIGDTTNKSD